MTMILKPIRTEADYQSVLKAAEAVFDAAGELDSQSEEDAAFDAIVTLIETYERKHYPVALSDPVETISF